MFCKNCGAQLTGTENNCPNCGTPVEKENKPVGPEPISATSAPAPNPFVVQPTVVEEPVATNQPVLPVEPTQLAQVMESQTIPEPPAMPVEAPQPQTLDQTLNQGNQVAPQEATPAPAPAPTPVAPQPAPVSGLQPMNPQPQVQQPAPGVMPGPQVQPTTALSTSAKQGGAKTALIIGGVFLLAIVIVSFLTGGFLGGESSQQTTNNGSGSTKDYAGYVFKVPNNCSATVLGSDLMIDSSERGFIINIDYTNPYTNYKDYYTVKYQDVNGDAINVIGGREYLIFRFNDSAGREISEFFTQLTTDVTIAGVVTHRDGSTVTKADYEALSTLLTGTSPSNNKVAKGDSFDSGKEGYIDFSTRKLNFFR